MEEIGRREGRSDGDQHRWLVVEIEVEKDAQVPEHDERVSDGIWSMSREVGQYAACMFQPGQ